MGEMMGRFKPKELAVIQAYVTETIRVLQEETAALRDKAE
jgi:hypothetical protein